MRCCFSFQAQIAWILSVSKLHFLTKDGGVISGTQDELWEQFSCLIYLFLGTRLDNFSFPFS